MTVTASRLPTEYTAESGRVVVRWSSPHLIEVHDPSGSDDPRERFLGPLLGRCEPQDGGWLCRLFADHNGRQLRDWTPPRRVVLVAWVEVRGLTLAEAWQWACRVADGLPAETPARETAVAA